MKPDKKGHVAKLRSRLRRSSRSPSPALLALAVLALATSHCSSASALVADRQQALRGQVVLAQQQQQQQRQQERQQQEQEREREQREQREQGEEQHQQQKRKRQRNPYRDLDESLTEAFAPNPWLPPRTFGVIEDHVLPVPPYSDVRPGVAAQDFASAPGEVPEPAALGARVEYQSQSQHFDATPKTYVETPQQAFGETRPEPPRSQEMQCVGAPTDWKDSRGFDCGVYESNRWCTISGITTNSWPSWWGAIEENVGEAGFTALQACCACGGGQKTLVVTKALTPLDERSLVASADTIPFKYPESLPYEHEEDAKATQARQDYVPQQYSRYFHELHLRQQQPDPLGLSGRFYTHPPRECSAYVVSQIDRGLDYRKGTGGSRKRLDEVVPSRVAAFGGYSWGLWTGSINIFTGGLYTFELVLGFDTNSTLEVDTQKLLTFGQCVYGKNENDCGRRGCLWLRYKEACVPYLTAEDQRHEQEVKGRNQGVSSASSSSSPYGVAAGVNFPDGTGASAQSGGEFAAGFAWGAPAPAPAASGVAAASGAAPAPSALLLQEEQDARLPKFTKAPAAASASSSEEASAPAPTMSATSQGASPGPAPVGAPAPAPASAPAPAPSPALAPSDASALGGAAGASGAGPGAWGGVGGGPGGGPGFGGHTGQGPVMPPDYLRRLMVAGKQPNQIDLVAGPHCVQVMVGLTPSAATLQLRYSGPDTEGVDTIVPGKVLYCDPVIPACERPALDACAMYKPICDAEAPPQPPPPPPPLEGDAPGQVPLQVQVEGAGRPIVPLPHAEDAVPVPVPVPAPAPAPWASPGPSPWQASVPAPAPAPVPAPGGAPTPAEAAGLSHVPLGVAPLTNFVSSQEAEEEEEDMNT